MKSLLIICGILVCSGSIAQSKKDLQEQIVKNNATIDSLEKVVANQENIIKNRDRTIRFHTEDLAKLKVNLKEEVKLKREKHEIIQKLRKRGATGTSKVYYMNNITNILKVPEGKYWVINQFMSDYSSEISTDTLGNTIVEEVHVFIQELNGIVLTDPANKLYGPKLFSSLHPEQTVRYPIVFTSGVLFKIAVFKGRIGALYPYNGKVYCTYTEKDIE